MKVMKWIRVQDKLPEEDIYVLVARWPTKEYDNPLYSIYIMNLMDGFWYDELEGEKLDPGYEIVTHWMSLPDHPKNEALSDG